MTNRYFILTFPNINSSIWDIIVEKPDTLRTNIKGNKCIVKLNVGDNLNHGVLNGQSEYTHNEILEIMNRSEWLNLETL